MKCGVDAGYGWHLLRLFYEGTNATSKLLEVDTKVRAVEEPKSHIVSTHRFPGFYSEGRNMSQEYQGPDRRQLPLSMRVEPSNGWVSRITLPFLLAVVVQVVGVVWWARGIQAENDALRYDFERHAEFNFQRHQQVMSLMKEIRDEVRANRDLVIEHMADGNKNVDH